ncbi:MAG: hypothetical protein ACKVT0_18600 [Planctomycetaceae bacterium]
MTRETEIEVELHAAPRPKTYFSRRFQSCDLILQKNPWRLSAVRYNQATNSQVVLVFSHIEFNPPLWDEPDLTGYKCLNPRGD